MTLQNRVMPWGEIVAVDARGTLMGNRGCLHDAQRRIVRPQASRRDWVTCRLAFKDRRRTLMAPGKSTELFFLDEATALAAGHRPCNECRPERFAAFRAAWAVGVLGLPGARPLVKEIDPVLHRDRLAARGVQRRILARLGDLPDGVMLRLAGEEAGAWLKWRGRLRAWTASGYGQSRSVPQATEVTVLTPACTVTVLASGYVPEVHPSAGG